MALHSESRSITTMRKLEIISNIALVFLAVLWILTLFYRWGFNYNCTRISHVAAKNLQTETEKEQEYLIVDPRPIYICNQ
jgi:hypothetical protein